MPSLERVLEKIENFLKTIIIKYWYIDATLTIGAFLILFIIQKIREKKEKSSE